MGSQKQLQFKLNGTLLNYSPDGWDNSLIQRGRHDIYHSLKSNFTTQLSFVKDGADIIKNIYYTQGFEGVCTLEILQLQPSTQTYLSIFLGNLDFSTFQDDSPFVKILASESSFWEMIKANEKTDYEIDIDSNNPVTINATFPKIEETQSYVIYEENITSYDAQKTHLVGITPSNSEVYENSSTSQTVTAFKTDFPFAPTNAFLIPNKNLTGLKYKLNIRADVYINAGLGSWEFRITNYSGATYWFFKQYDLYYPSMYGHVNSFILDISGDLLIPTINVGSELYLSVKYTVNGGASSLNETLKLEGTLDISYLSALNPRTIKAIRPITVLNQLITKMNDGVAIPIQSNPFLNNINDYLITSGDALRSFSSSKIKINFNDFYNSINSIFTCGFGYENGQIIFRELEYFYNNTEIMNLGTISDFKLETYKTPIVNSLLIGYEEQNYDGINGRYEVNQSQQWTLPIKKIAKAGSFVSKIRADVLEIIFNAINLSGKETTDSSSDNDTFMLHTSTTGVTTTLFRDNTYLNQGVPDGASWFNVNLSPKRCLIRKLKYINSFLHNISGLISFQTGTKNTGFRSRLSTESAIVIENEPINTNILTDRLFLAYICTIKTIIDKNLNEGINLNPNGYISFDYNGEVFKGYIHEIAINPSKKTEYEVKLILHPDTDVTKLI